MIQTIDHLANSRGFHNTPRRLIRRRAFAKGFVSGMIFSIILIYLLT